jgi:hypothetical protein
LSRDRWVPRWPPYLGTEPLMTSDGVNGNAHVQVPPQAVNEDLGRRRRRESQIRVPQPDGHENPLLWGLVCQALWVVHVDGFLES